jgi:hypothetical protein
MTNPKSVCCFESVAEDIKDMLRLAEAEATAKGEEAIYKSELLSALYPFLESPSHETSIPLLKIAPQFQGFFDLHMEYEKLLGPLGHAAEAKEK